MRAMPLLKCIAKAVLKIGGNAIGFGLGDVAAAIADHVWDDGEKDREAAERRKEVEAIVQMAAKDFRKEVAAVIEEVAVDQPEAVRQQLSECLEQVPDLARQAFRRSDDPEGRSAPPGWQPKNANDLVPLLSFAPKGMSHRESPHEKKHDALAHSGRPKVLLQFTKGPFVSNEHTYSEPTVLLFGRGQNSSFRFSDLRPKRLSRHHCLLEINPPDVRVCDMGSLHGTLVNGTLIGKRPKGSSPQAGFESHEHDVKDGDEVQLTEEGQVAFVIRIVVPAVCCSCGIEIGESDKAASAQATGGYMCAACREKNRKRECAWCHREVAEQRGANRPGMFVCEDCRNNFRSMMEGLVSQAKKGDHELRAIRNYTVVEELGHGGMGAVYLARDKSDKPVAIKLMLPQVAADDLAVELFQREIRNCKALEHQHIVRLKDDGFARGVFFMVMEYCDGGDVELLMRRRKDHTLPVDEAVEIILQALEGLEYAHTCEIPFVKQKGGGYSSAKGMVHRDLKPTNLFLSGQGSSRITKLGDFGLAKAFDESGLSGGSRTGKVAGTWKFMCRKQVTDYKHAGAEVDVWAMAATLYAMLTGQAPREFPKELDPWPYRAVLECSSIPILKRNPKVPSRLAELIDHALMEEPEMPYKTAREFKEALENAL